jgi:D-arginine dehydrogenase
MIQPLTSASFAYLEGGGFLHPRGALHLGPPGRSGALDRLERQFAGSGVPLRRIGREVIEAMIPGVVEGFADAMLEPSCRDIDVAALHTHYLKRAKQAGAVLLCDAHVVGLTRDAGGWRIETSAGLVGASKLVCAGGAWASDLARMAGAAPIAITPYRRTVVQLQVDPMAAPDLPLVIDADEKYYFKPEAGGRIWLSPHDETPTAACDAAPEPIDIALAIDRLEHVVDWRIVKRERAWAGLRSFAPDRAPVYGHDPVRPDFFWFAGQGGFGIQTAPAAAMIGAAILLDRTPPDSVSHIDRSCYAPERFAVSAP